MGYIGPAYDQQAVFRTAFTYNVEGFIAALDKVVSNSFSNGYLGLDSADLNAPITGIHCQLEDYHDNVCSYTDTAKKQLGLLWANVAHETINGQYVEEIACCSQRNDFVPTSTGEVAAQTPTNKCESTPVGRIFGCTNGDPPAVPCPSLDGAECGNTGNAYHGRGPIQLTWDYNYLAFQSWYVQR